MITIPEEVKELVKAEKVWEAVAHLVYICNVPPGKAKQIVYDLI